jgi:hypothetical protein
MTPVSNDDFFLIPMLVDQFLFNDPLSSIPFPPHLQKEHPAHHVKNERFKFAHHNLYVRADVMVTVQLGRTVTEEERLTISSKVKEFLKQHGF